MKKKVAIIGYGNIGKAVAQAINTAADLEVAAIVKRTPEKIDGYNVVDSIDKLKCDVAIICTPSRTVRDLAKELLKRKINCVDCFDIHSEIYNLKCELDEIAKKYSAVSITSAGWDPGSDSVIRALFLAMSPKGITYTNFGPGMSMGHSVCAKSKAQVVDAVSVTIPAGAGVHNRMVYVQLENGADFKEVERQIKSDAYFANDFTKVIKVDDVSALKDLGHGVLISRKGGSGDVHNQQFSYEMRANNPALTAQIMVSCARAALKQKSGCYTMIEIAPIDYLDANIKDLIEKLV